MKLSLPSRVIVESTNLVRVYWDSCTVFELVCLLTITHMHDEYSTPFSEFIYSRTEFIDFYIELDKQRNLCLLIQSALLQGDITEEVVKDIISYLVSQVVESVEGVYQL